MTLASFLSRTSFSRPELSWGISWPPSVCGSGCSCRWRRRLSDVSQASAPHPAHRFWKIIIIIIESASQQMPHYHVMFSTFIRFFYPTLFASKDSRYSLADSCPSSLLYPLVNSPSACLDGLKGIQMRFLLDCKMVFLVNSKLFVPTKDHHHIYSFSLMAL